MAARRTAVKEAAAAAEEKTAKTAKTTAAKTEKKTVKPAAAKVEAEEKTVNAAEEKPAAKKAPAKKAALKETVILQFAGRETDYADVMKKVKEYWTKELKKKVGDMASVTIYLKPEEGKAYFVINGDVTGSFAI